MLKIGYLGPEGTFSQQALQKYQGMYLIALGGCGALYQTCVKNKVCLAYPELLSEAIYKLEVKSFPVMIYT